MRSSAPSSERWRVYRGVPRPAALHKWPKATSTRKGRNFAPTEHRAVHRPRQGRRPQPRPWPSESREPNPPVQDLALPLWLSRWMELQSAPCRTCKAGGHQIDNALHISYTTNSSAGLVLTADLQVSESYGVQKYTPEELKRWVLLVPVPRRFQFFLAFLVPNPPGSPRSSDPERFPTPPLKTHCPS